MLLFVHSEENECIKMYEVFHKPFMHISIHLYLKLGIIHVYADQLN